MMDKKHVLMVLSPEEIQLRLKNPKKYKLEGLVTMFKQHIKEAKKDNDMVLLKGYTKALKEVKAGKNIDEWFSTEFPEEPTDAEINQFKR